jgi:hypothetical protein
VIVLAGSAHELALAFFFATAPLKAGLSKGSLSLVVCEEKVERSRNEIDDRIGNYQK